MNLQERKKIQMHPKVEEAFDQIDAAIFSGDGFFNEQALETLEYYIKRWQREANRIKENNYFQGDENEKE